MAADHRWQQTIAGVGPTGADKGKGGKFLVIPLDFKGTVPEGYYTVTSPTAVAAYFARGIVRNDDVAGAANSLETTQIYPLSMRNNPPRITIVPCTGKDVNTIEPESFKSWDRVAEVINYVSDSEDGARSLTAESSSK
jgi:hypothetical protein